MRSYFIVFLLGIILAGTVFAQTAVITLSFSQTVDHAHIAALSPNAPQSTLDLGNQYFVQSIQVNTNLPRCEYYFWRYDCGSISLCAKFDQDQAQTCKQLSSQASQTVTFPVNKLIRTITFSYIGSRTTAEKTYQVQITNVKRIGGTYKQITRSLLSLRGTGPIPLGRVKEIIDVTGYTGDVFISSTNLQAPAWFDDGTGTSATTRTKTSNHNDDTFACLNADTNTDAQGNPKCDYQDEYACAQQNKDWFKGYCCGDAPYSPATGCQWYADKQAVCGKDSEEQWRWAALEDVGLITSLSGNCPAIQIVSDGNTFYTCSQSTQTVIPSNLTKPLTGKINIQGHEYLCEGQTIIECGGNAPYSPTAKLQGATITYNNQIHYCSSDGTWKTSLDDDNEACVSAGLTYTGTKCCGEANDPLKTYQDPYNAQGTAGACYNNQFIASGSFLTADKKIINYRGAYYICDPSLPQGSTELQNSTLFLNTGITPTARGPCGLPLQTALLTGTQQNIVCTPTGEWRFTSTTNETLVKETKWTPLETEQRQGCCPDNQCWDGKTCKGIGSYYLIGERGFQCR
jgi:hypothetical protein